VDRTFEVLGLFLCCGARLGIPIVLTILLAWGLKRLDAHWRKEAESKADQSRVKETAVSKVRCWEIRNCAPELRAVCPAYTQPNMPCWEVLRANGHLRERCRECIVLERATVLAGI
jgi:hypothetical protein